MNIRISTYDKKHQELFRINHPRYDTIKAIDNKIIDIPRQDFLIYSLFKEQKDKRGFRSYSELKNKLPTRLGIFKDYLDFDSHTIRAQFDNAEDQKIITESVGIGAALSIVSHIHGLTAADWNVIPVGPVKDLDFHIASDGNNIIEVECKGNFGNPKEKNSTVSKMKKHIEEKKSAQRTNGNKNILYGAITSYDNEKGNISHCRLLDPESDNVYDSPFKSRVISRLRHYYKGLSFISKSHFLIALTNRIETLNILDEKNFLKMDNLSLKKIDGESFGFPVSYEFQRTKVPGMDAFANVSKIGKNKYFLFGYHNEIVDALIKQDFDLLTKMKFQPKTIYETINARLKENECQSQGEYYVLQHGFVEQKLKGISYCSSDGTIFGVYKH